MNDLFIQMISHCHGGRRELWKWAPEMSERMIQTTVGRLRVRIEGDEPSRGTAVLWHSLFVDERTWDRVVPDLAQDRRLILITGPGHGASGDPGRRYTLQDCADAAAEVLHAADVPDPVDWVGNAWGGHVGLVLAAGRPELVRTLIAASSSIHPWQRAVRLQTQLVLLPVYRLLGPVGFIVDAVVEGNLSQATRLRDRSAETLVRDCFTQAEPGAHGQRDRVDRAGSHGPDPPAGVGAGADPVTHRFRAPRLVGRAGAGGGGTPAPRIQRCRGRRRLLAAARGTGRLQPPGAPVLGTLHHP